MANVYQALRRAVAQRSPNLLASGKPAGLAEPSPLAHPGKVLRLRRQPEPDAAPALAAQIAELGQLIERAELRFERDLRASELKVLGQLESEIRSLHAQISVVEQRIPRPVDRLVVPGFVLILAFLGWITYRI